MVSFFDVISSKGRTAEIHLDYTFFKKQIRKIISCEFLFTSFEEAKVTHTSLASSVWQTIVYKVEFMTRAQNLKNKMRNYIASCLDFSILLDAQLQKYLQMSGICFFAIWLKKLVKSLKSQTFQRIVREAISKPDYG